MKFLSNAFALSMLTAPTNTLTVNEVSVDDAALFATTATSVVGHDDTANLFANILAQPVTANRCSIALNPGDQLLVGQYTGPRLPEGTQVLPEGATIRWLMVTL